jgi:hypothetical protein
MRISIHAARLAIVASIVALAALASLHVLSPEFDPSWRVVSEYALGRFGWVLSVMFVAWGLSSWALAWAIRRAVDGVGGRVGLVLLVVSGIGEALAAAFDLRHAVMHGVAGLLGVFPLPIAASLIGASVGRRSEWVRIRMALRVTAGLTWVSMAVLCVAIFTLTRKIGGHRIAIGWPNRILVLVYLIWTATVAWSAIRVRNRGEATAAN